MAVLFRPDGSSSAVAPQNGTDFQLEELYALLQCRTIEIVPTIDGRLLIIDEEGKLKQHYMNASATRLVRLAFADDYIAGLALVCRRKEVL